MRFIVFECDDFVASANILRRYDHPPRFGHVPNRRYSDFYFHNLGAMLLGVIAIKGGR